MATTSGGTSTPRLVAAHRGASDALPENTIVALAAAVELGCDFVEFDVRATRDGRLVLMHDETLDRTTDGTGPVAAKTLHELRALDAGAWLSPDHRGRKIPTLNETLAVLKDTAAFIVDFKENAPALVDELALCLRADGVLDKALVASGDLSVLAAVSRSHPDVGLAVPYSLAFAADGTPRADSPKPRLVLARAADASAMAASAAHAAGLRLLATLPRDLDLPAARALADQLEARGVDGIMTSRARAFLSSGLRVL